MKISEKQKGKYSAFMSDFWALVKEYGQPEDTDGYGDSLRDAVTALGKKYDNDVILDEILVGLCIGVSKVLQENKA